MRYVFTCILAVCFYTLFAQLKTTTLARPKLVIGIVIDQMRYDYLYRYYNRYQANGFKRMLIEGASCENTYINYIPTVTAAGHSSIYTGSVPAIHGIAGNEFIIEATGKTMYCTEDSSVNSVGTTSNAGKMSPRNMLTSTITDELRLATNFKGKVIGISLKDRGSILPAGHTANAAYWFDNSGNWITSTYYMDALPMWVDKFNAEKLPAKYLKKDWNTLYDIKTYTQSLPDDNAYEGKLSVQKRPVFPIKTGDAAGGNLDMVRSTPYGNSLTLDFAKAAIVNEGLGKDEITDFLTVSFSSPDYIAHLVGLNAIEIEDTYLRLDNDLAELFSYLDANVGKGQFTVFLTADHGAAHNPNYLSDVKIPAGVYNMGQLLRDCNAMLFEKYKVQNLILSLSNYQVHLNHTATKAGNVNESTLRKDVVDFISLRPNIAFVADVNNMDESVMPKAFKEAVLQGYNSKRSGVITFIPEPGWYSGTQVKVTGTTHGSPYNYDSHIPLLWMGWGIQKGRINRPVYMTDIAPTVAALLHIQEPNGSIGKPIAEVIK